MNTLPQIIVLLEPYQDMTRLYKSAKRRAAQKNQSWAVLMVETPSLKNNLNKAAQQDVLNSLALAERQGAKIIKTSARTMEGGVIDILKGLSQQSTASKTIIIANKRNKMDKVLGRAGLGSRIKSNVPFDVKVVKVAITQDSIRSAWHATILHVNFKNLLMSIMAVIAATLIIEGIDAIFPSVISESNRNKAIIYMIACVFSASRYGLLAGLIASVSSFLALNLLYVEPRYLLIINDRNEMINLGLFLISAIIITVVGSRDFDCRHVLTRRIDRLNSLLSIHRITLNKETPREAIRSLDDELSQLLETKVAFFLPSIMDPNKLESMFFKDIELSEQDEEALQRCWLEGVATGLGTEYNANGGGNWRFEPLLTVEDEIGVLGIFIEEHIELDVNFSRLLSGVADQVALILERLQIEQIAENSKIQAEREKLRSMLLSSVSHDLKTPLASVIGSLSVYRIMREKLPPAQRATLINTALEEAQRLDSFITNILDMTKIESGQIELKQEWVDPQEMVSGMVKRLKNRLSEHDIHVFPGEDVEILTDHMMTGQVVQNLLDNAAKYTKPHTRIDIGWHIRAGQFELFIRDHGGGIPENKIDKIFDKYERINRQDSQVAGTGLGLAIAKAVMVNQQGDIIAANHPEGGAIFTLSLPSWRPIKQIKKEVA